MSINSILFFGNYPNEIDKNLNVFFRNIIYQFADMGIQCTVITPVSITKYRSRIHKIPIERFELTKSGARVRVISPRFISFSSKIIGKLDTHVWTVKEYRRVAIAQVKKYDLKFDATYGHFINIGGIPACKVAQKYNVPAFVANGESDLNPRTYNYESKYDLSAFRSCSGVISVSTKNAEELKALNLISPKLIRVIPNAVDLEVFTPKSKNECRKLMGIPNDVVLGCFVGGFSERKGDKRVLEASAGIPNLKLAFAGAGAVKPSGDNVVFCDSVIHNELPILLNASDFFVLPTLNEGCCNAIIEAMACGLPVISSDLKFNDDILNDSNSIRVNPNSITEIHDAMELLVNNKEIREKLSKGAIKMANSLGIENRATKILEFMNSHRIER